MLVTEFMDIDQALQTIQENEILRRRLAVFAGSDTEGNRELKGATRFLKALVRMAEQNADRSKNGRR